jgi:phage tail-like protein
MSEQDPDLGTGNGEGDLSGLFLTGPGFGTVRFSGAVGTRPPPRVASTRGLLRTGMPAIYQDDDFGMRFLAGLEELLDPVVALLDALPEHLSPDLAPADVLELITGWLGIQLNESQPTLERREIVRNASELGRRRGTRRGIELALALGFPSLPFRVDDGGGVVWSSDGELPEAPAPGFVVYCDRYIAEERQAAVARLIEQVKPAHVAYKLRVKAPKAPRNTPADPAP